MAIGPLFDDITINVLYNVISTIVQESITSVEMWVAYGGSTEVEVIDIVENIIDHNEFTEQPGGEIEIEPIQEPEDVSYEMVEIEMEMEMPDMEIEIPEMEIETPEMEMASVESEVEMEMEIETQSEPESEINEPEPELGQEEVQNEPTEEDTKETEPTAKEEPKQEESSSEVAKNEDSEEDMEETEDKDQDEVKKEESKKEVAAKKILKKMGDKGRYDSANQLKTLIVMQVLGNSKSFFETQQSLNDIEGFFTDTIIPDAELTTNNIAQYFLFGGSDVLMDEMIMQQWQK
jgi:outer membrane biosynthesis protein TonB